MLTNLCASNVFDDDENKNYESTSPTWNLMKYIHTTTGNRTTAEESLYSWAQSMICNSERIKNSWLDTIVPRESNTPPMLHSPATQIMQTTTSITPDSGRQQTENCDGKRSLPVSNSSAAELPSIPCPRLLHQKMTTQELLLMVPGIPYRQSLDQRVCPTCIQPVPLLWDPPGNALPADPHLRLVASGIKARLYQIHREIESQYVQALRRSRGRGRGRGRHQEEEAEDEAEEVSRLVLIAKRRQEKKQRRELRHRKKSSIA